MFSINYVNQNAYDSIAQLFEGTSGKVSLKVRNAANLGGFSQNVLDVVQKTEGVEEALPVLQLLAALPEETPDKVSLSFFGMGSGGLTLYGIDPVKAPVSGTIRSPREAFWIKTLHCPRLSWLKTMPWKMRLK